ncbi:MAG: DNA/RNA non-specific endonuclease [Eubacteriales bacterium]|nr:DNA/RNA non-specific endonuclease [Eubacteriales bacterium]
MNKRRWLAALLLFCLLLSGCEGGQGFHIGETSVAPLSGEDKEEILAVLPEYTSEASVEVNGNVPFFSEDELTEESFESYAELDELGRCDEAVACVGQDLMPTEKRGEIGSVKPSGWQKAKYVGLVDGNYLYNRCHLIGYQLSGENANEQNLITGTRYMNVEGMLPYENEVADYVDDTDNHVMYRVTPMFEGDDLVARGVLMEAYSVEDEGEGVCFNVFCYNVQPGIEIDYETGRSARQEDFSPKDDENKKEQYVLNKNTGKFHRTNCSSLSEMSGQNRKYYKGSREDLIAQGYEPCGRCKP